MHEYISVVSYEMAGMVIKLGDELTKCNPEWDQFNISKETYENLKQQKEEMDKAPT